MNKEYYRFLKYGMGILVFLFCIPGCRPANPPQAKEILFKARKVHGSEILNRATVRFVFRGKSFEVRRFDGFFLYKRRYTDSVGMVEEALSNTGITQFINGKPQVLDEKAKAKIETDLNSVVYFALLPFNLDDEAVRSQYLGQAEIQGEPYYKVGIRFTPSNGGKDWQDRYIYWFHQSRGTMDYLAYYYHTNETGSRFRKAVRVRERSGVRFADYENYADPESADRKIRENLVSFPTRFEQGRLRLLSEVNLEGISVVPLTQTWASVDATH